MKHNSTGFGIGLAALIGGLAAASSAHAALIEDSTARLELRNFYFNNDFHQSDAAQSKSDEWAQGFRLRFESGYTEGVVGVGFDAIGLLGVKLDSGPDRRGSGLLPVGSDKAPSDYSQLGLTAKAKVSKTTVHLGTLIPNMPLVLSNDTRLLPQSFRGIHLKSNDIDRLTLNMGRLTRNSVRNASASEDMIMAGPGVTGAELTDQFDFFTASYNWGNNLVTAYHYGHLDKNYKQHIAHMAHEWQLGNSRSFKTDLRYADSDKDGNTNVDNQALGAMLTYRAGGHGLGVAYQQMRGDSGFPVINGTNAFLVNFVMIAPYFANPDEKSWQARYDYNFAAMGIPGLTFMTRYVRGDEFKRGGIDSKEWERNTDIHYVIQSGKLKNLGISWRNGSYRSTGGSDIDQNRLMLNYTISLL